MIRCAAGAGNDTYLFADGWGQDEIIDSGGSLDALDFSMVTTALDIDLLNHSIESDGNSVAFSGIESVAGGQADDVFHIEGTQSYNLYGNAGNDQFIFLSEGRLLGLIDGGAGDDILDYSGDETTFAVQLYFNLTSAGSDGFNGTEELTIRAGFLNIDQIISGLELIHWRVWMSRRHLISTTIILII